MRRGEVSQKVAEARRRTMGGDGDPGVEALAAIVEDLALRLEQVEKELLAAREAANKARRERRATGR